MADSVTSSSEYKSFVNALQDITNIKWGVDAKIQATSFISTLDNTSNIPHNLIYDSVHDDLLVFYDGILLQKNDNYIENIDTISIDLNGWTISTGESIFFKLYKAIK